MPTRSSSECSSTSLRASTGGSSALHAASLPGRKNGRENDRSGFLHPPQGLDLEQGQRRRVREHQPPDRRADAREGAPGRAPPVAALFARHPERRQSHRDARGAPRRSGTRAPSTTPGSSRSTRATSSAAASSRSTPTRRSRRSWTGADRVAGSRLRVGRDPPLPRGEVRRVLAQGPRRAHRVPVVALLADGRRRRTSAAASATSMRMRRPRSNTRSTGSRWR